MGTPGPPRDVIARAGDGMVGLVCASNYLISVSALHVTLISSKSMVYLLKDHDPVGLSANRSVGFPKCTVLIGRTGFDTIPSVPDPTLSENALIMWALHSLSLRWAPNITL